MSEGSVDVLQKDKAIALCHSSVALSCYSCCGFALIHFFTMGSLELAC